MNKRSVSVMNWRNRSKAKLVAYKGGKCQICDYSKGCPAVYHFHHRDPGSKDFLISGKSFSFERLQQEVDKCDLLCSNCHAELHWNAHDNLRVEYLRAARKIVPFVELVCPMCDLKFVQQTHGQKYCTPGCASLARRKVVDRPTQRQLQELLLKVPMTTIGRMYGVTDNSVRKWAKAYNLL
jgi:hypothetical protein